MGKKSWKEKLHNAKDLPKIVELKGKMAEKWGPGRMVVPSPLDVDRIMKKVPYGKLITVGQIREILKRQYRVDVACPLTTGIFVKIASFAAEEERMEGKKDITPYWRTIKNDGSIDKKLPLSDIEIAKILESEGHKVVQKGKKLKVVDFQKKLVDIDHLGSS